jgi:hypothetical protein
MTPGAFAVVGPGAPVPMIVIVDVPGGVPVYVVVVVE